MPEWLERATVYSDERGRDMPYVMANDLAALLYLTNLGCIDHNPWSSRAESQDFPDYVSSIWIPRRELRSVPS